MPDEHHSNFSQAPQLSKDFGKVPQGPEAFRTIPNTSETFRTIPQGSERKENHILTVREVAKMFEVAGVARTERSIVNWCQPNSTGMARLDAYKDPNEGKYFITPQSAEAAIKEEQAKFAKSQPVSDPFRNNPDASEAGKTNARNQPPSGEIEELRFKLRESEISSRVKDQVIAKLERDNGRFIEQLIDYSRTIGQLENQLHLEGPKPSDPAPSEARKRLYVVSEKENSDSETSSEVY